ncbi:hypothetical protein LTR02_003332 [Friedmanniomyces endolithicus]|uniref:Uncharacterized protein n=1 Tax=Rachicladosporium monterosium TaxID=1507873 RepID=A0ABR0LC51_9PEZI|nr:hypothetical protein LTR94_000478 [Friedmanniomyces endolithicus]KAK5146636.1 hypothetical protein LTR32_001813 [Rachicladosporium monterosium]KAK0769475.1 hypothetical protein LTR38_017865 [Friedmanniomyces endolithicus]KAK0806842.1 hypothetical protein LTR59_003518 [Friedmanniomyces endolithicus]KAK0857678.1 hypothetical protein LTR03_000713 [Friedmanniomyces endolithicus]
MSLFPGVALITGAGSGIGQATAVSFAREGCEKIVIADRNEQGLDNTRDAIQKVNSECEVYDVRIDVSSAESVDYLVDEAVKIFGRVDYCCNAAGVLSNNERSDATSPEEFDRINGINYRGCWLCSRAEIKQMLKQEPLATHDGRKGNRGSVVNIASQLGIVGRPAALSRLTTRWQVIDTPMTRPNMDVLGSAIAIAPMDRAGTAQEVADCVLFLASSKATFVQGSALVVDGGYVIN